MNVEGQSLESVFFCSPSLAGAICLRLVYEHDHFFCLLSLFLDY